MRGDRGVNIRFDFRFTTESNKEEVQIPLDYQYVLICIFSVHFSNAMRIYVHVG